MTPGLYAKSPAFTWIVRSVGNAAEAGKGTTEMRTTRRPNIAQKNPGQIARLLAPIPPLIEVMTVLWHVGWPILGVG